jgi:hypothetical protein
MSLRFIPVNSSAVDAVAYDEESRTLYVRFKCKNRAEVPKIWGYCPVDRRDFEALINGESVGKFVHRLRNDDTITQERVVSAEVPA